ncbi:CHASE2 domain-containing protein [Paenibacillus gansuensis]|uniref:CHASE2 domain-containing protein n=1 Tax=Paenibacillus gansuensis TaxID=306542 RepID=A0ABW5PIF8_9BACL
MDPKVKRIALWGNVAVALLCFLLFSKDVLQVLDRALYSFNMQKAASHQPHEDIVVVGIDEESLQELGTFPWSRDVYIPFLEYLNQPEAKPKAIGFDIMFNSPSQDQPENDQALAKALAQYDNVIFPSYGDTDHASSRTSTAQSSRLLQVDKVNHPLPAFYDVTQHAHINALLDSDGMIRRTWLQLQTPDGPLDSMALKAASMYGADVKHYLDYRSSRTAKGEIAIDYDADSYDFTTIPFVSVLNGDIPPDVFKDKIVLVGFTAVGFENDNGITPLEQEMKLVYAHANIVNQLLHGTYITFINPWFTLMLMLLLFSFIIWVTWRLKTIYSMLTLFALAAGLLLIQYLTFSGIRFYMDSISPLAVLFLGYLTNVAVKSFFETKQRHFITKQFGRYLSPDLVKQISSSNIEIQLGGITKELTILFLDIRGFTTLSERLKPEEVVDFLNTMFNLITEKALVNRGTIDKFIGDAAMILYNAPLDVENHEYCAVKTAYDIQRGMEQVRGEIEQRYGVTISVGIGINTGEVVVGNIGSYLRVDYTAIGDNVNIAARIESNTVANQVLVSDSTYERTKDMFEYNCIGERMMKGKTVPVKLYEVLGLKDCQPGNKQL